MYHLFYWAYAPKHMCTFSNYSDCKKALEVLNAKYPTAKIWIEKIEFINSFEEWKDTFNSRIEEYEK